MLSFLQYIQIKLRTYLLFPPFMLRLPSTWLKQKSSPSSGRDTLFDNSAGPFLRRFVSDCPRLARLGISWTEIEARLGKCTYAAADLNSGSDSKTNTRAAKQSSRSTAVDASVKVQLSHHQLIPQIFISTNERWHRIGWCRSTRSERKEGCR